MTELISKSEDGDWEAVKQLLVSGADPTLWDDKPLADFLFYAALNGHVEVVRILLAGREPRHRRESLLSMTADIGMSCLHFASQNGHLEVVKVLVEAGGQALLNKTNEDGASCLALAAQNGHLEVVKVLVKAGGRALLKITPEDGWSCLHSVCQSGHLKIVKVLVKAGGQELLNMTDEDGWSCLHLVCQSGHLEIVKVLVKSGTSQQDLRRRRLVPACSLSEWAPGGRQGARRGRREGASHQDRADHWKLRCWKHVPARRRELRPPLRRALPRAPARRLPAASDGGGRHQGVGPRGGGGPRRCTLLAAGGRGAAAGALCGAGGA
jgi:ankyrin repeat protein